MNEPFLVDTAKLRDHLILVREKQNYCRDMLDDLRQAMQMVSPTLQQECYSLFRHVEEFYHYYREQETVLIEMCNSYDATGYQVAELLESATKMAQYAF